MKSTIPRTVRFVPESDPLEGLPLQGFLSGTERTETLALRKPIPALSSFATQMEGNPAQFEAIGNRLGFRVEEESDRELCLVWQGPRFPAFLCLGIALLLLSVSVPIL